MNEEEGKVLPDRKALSCFEVGASAALAFVVAFLVAFWTMKGWA